MMNEKINNSENRINSVMVVGKTIRRKGARRALFVVVSPRNDAAEALWYKFSRPLIQRLGWRVFCLTSYKFDDDETAAKAWRVAGLLENRLRGVSFEEAAGVVGRYREVFGLPGGAPVVIY